ncbi:tRNA dihydrouridine synthase DusB [Candidatus Methylospira mobilis]|uniref:tRNA-dihydrouridine synthase B n=1 Tax=Candidatus Methylospira mobilis TaxID=1808979 RepID=A0A5Q0BLZ0_9GAMM|nr:tRNA dihydrouridine synthase DusB [Candidatus Methylospira mobilis]QFY44780.1 tRNA dihydrouridine synthase DusB [Candidatus Methylospira mobilis]WNV05679.1 tRNA dihydrouridine synthase DusB [Candidatus Methylospira mobilis]
MRIGPYTLTGRVILAPMAGVTDLPFRLICRRHGAAMAVSEMVSSRPDLQTDARTLLRTDHSGEPAPRATQILGADPLQMAESARLNVERGAQIIDINMGCPAKKVCNVAAGSALLRDEKLVGRILDTVVAAVSVPVTLKIRTGWDQEQRNAVTIAKIAESAGIQALTVHGRTRACGFSGEVEYNTISDVKRAVNIPVIANGDICSPALARKVMDATGADAVMVGRGALGRPWLFTQLDLELSGTPVSDVPSAEKRKRVILEHVHNLHVFYGRRAGLRIARKHIAWYAKHWPEINPAGLRELLAVDDADLQHRLTDLLFD